MTDADDAGSGPSGPSPREGELFAGRYRLAEILGRGATGTVYRARDQQTGDDVALKVLHAAMADDPGVARRFAREARSAAALRHPNVVVIRDAGPEEAIPYIAMELVDGETLGAMLTREGPLSVARAAELGGQILDAVGEAHARRIVHRDLKPENVMLTKHAAGVVAKVCDFGLAKAFSPDDTASGAPPGSSLTMHGQLCGTPDYMSPEQAEGEPLDGRSDLYSFSVILFRMVTGELPFKAKTAVGMLSRHLGQKPPRPTELRPDLPIPQALEALILRGMAKDRGERPPTAAVYRAELEQIARDFARAPADGRAARANAATVRLPAPPRRRRWIPVAIGGGAVALIAGALSARALLDGVDEVQPPPVATRPVIVDPPATVETPPAMLPPAAAPVVAAQRAATRQAPRAFRRSAAARRVDAAPVVTPPTPSIAARLSAAGELLEEGKTTEACAAAQALVAEAPRNPQIQRFLGKCLMRAGRTAEARQHYRRYLELAPNAVDALWVREIVNPR